MDNFDSNQIKKLDDIENFTELYRAMAQEIAPANLSRYETQSGFVLLKNNKRNFFELTPNGIKIAMTNGDEHFLLKVSTIEDLQKTYEKINEIIGRFENQLEFALKNRHFGANFLESKEAIAHLLILRRNIANSIESIKEKINLLKNMIAILKERITQKHKSSIGESDPLFAEKIHDYIQGLISSKEGDEKLDDLLPKMSYYAITEILKSFNEKIRKSAFLYAIDIETKIEQAKEVSLTPDKLIQLYDFVSEMSVEGSLNESYRSVPFFKIQKFKRLIGATLLEGEYRRKSIASFQKHENGEIKGVVTFLLMGDDETVETQVLVPQIMSGKPITFLKMLRTKNYAFNSSLVKDGQISFPLFAGIFSL